MIQVESQTIPSVDAIQWTMRDYQHKYGLTVIDEAQHEYVDASAVKSMRSRENPTRDKDYYQYERYRNGAYDVMNELGKGGMAGDEMHHCWPLLTILSAIAH